MKNNILIIANGRITNRDFHKQIIENSDIIICADGGANTAKDMGLIPDYIIGDFDSIDASTINFFKHNRKTKIIKDENQEKTDLELAIKLAESLDPTELLIIGAIGNRIDHTLANILSLTQIKPSIKTQIIDYYNTIELVESSIDIVGKRDEIISVIPLTDLIGLTYKGLKWLVKNKNSKFGWFAISNRLSKNQANIKIKNGKILLIRVKE
jgi:thiamine pyrophosphokinase